jgi:putative ABC transport system substrate-binding protein
VRLRRCAPDYICKTTRKPMVGFLAAGALANNRTWLNVLQGLSADGYVAGKDMAFEARFAGASHRLPRLAEELVGLSPDILIAGNGRGGVDS